eukprot:SAG22_NODE_156_length_16999_cov_8.168047_6_plen_544_part_00
MSLSLLLRLSFAAQTATAAADITFGPPVTLGGTGNVGAQQFPSGALGAAQAEHVLTRGAAAGMPWRTQNVSRGLAPAYPECATNPSACPGVCDVKTRWTKKTNMCPTAPEYYRWGGAYAPELATDGDALVDFGRLLPDDEKNRSWTSPNRSRYRYSASDGKLTVATEATTIRFTGLPRSARIPPQAPSMIRLMGAAWLDLGGGKQLQTAMVAFNSTGQACPFSQSIVAFISDDGGKTYEYSGMVADAADMPFSQEGANEHDCQLIPSGRSHEGQGGDLMIGCAIRVDGGDGPINHHYLPYYWTHSSDGRVWSKPVPMNGTGCARPRLLLLGEMLLMSGACAHDRPKALPCCRDAVLLSLLAHALSLSLSLSLPLPLSLPLSLSLSLPPSLSLVDCPLALPAGRNSCIQGGECETKASRASSSGVPTWVPARPSSQGAPRRRSGHVTMSHTCTTAAGVGTNRHGPLGVPTLPRCMLSRPLPTRRWCRSRPTAPPEDCCYTPWSASLTCHRAPVVRRAATRSTTLRLRWPSQFDLAAAAEVTTVR